MLLLANLPKHNIRFYNNEFECKRTKGNNGKHNGCTASSDVVPADASHIADVVPLNADHVAMKPL